MFEEELELEKKEGGGFGPLLIILMLVGVFVGGIGYVIYQSKQTLKPEEATLVLNDVFANQGPAFVQFHTGTLASSVDDKVSDPHYKLLQKAGILIVKPGKGQAMIITLTPDGEKKIAAFPEFKKTTEKDGTILYAVPLATRQLVKIDKIEKLSPSSALVEYTWKWKPNDMGQVFDASGTYVKAFNTWDRSVLIQKHGADFYNADPQKLTVKMVKGSKGWQLANE